MTITREFLIDKLMIYVSKQLTDKVVAITPKTHFSDLGLDSHSLLETILYLENEFGIELPDGDLTSANLTSVESLAACAFRNQQATGQK